MQIFKIYCYTENAEKLFNYESNVIPMVGDTYAQPCGIEGHFEVTQRLLHTPKDGVNTNIISLWLKSR